MLRSSFLLSAALVALAVLAASPAVAQSAPPPADSLSATTIDVLPDRTAAALATLLLVSGDDPSLLGTDYRSAGAPQFVVDGLRAGRVDGLPQASLSSLAVPTGYASPRLGNALGAFVELDTRETSRGDIGRAEGLGGLDAFGYGLASAEVGLGTDAVRFFGAGTFERADDLDPRAYGTPTLSADELAALREAPQVIRVDRALADASGFDASRARYTSEEFYYLPLPPALDEATRGALAARLSLSDPDAIVSLNPISSLAVRSEEVPLETTAPSSEGERLRGHLALEAAPTEALRLRLSGQGWRETGRAFSTALAFAAPDAIPATRDEAWRALAEADAAVGAGTLTLAASAENAERLVYDGRFSDDIGEVLRYGDIDDPANAAAAGYRRFDGNGAYIPALRDGEINPASPYNTFAGIGAISQGYARETAVALRFAAAYRQRVGALDLSLGAEVERQTFRGVEVLAGRLAQFVNDDDVEVPIVDTDGDGIADSGVDAYADLPFEVAEPRISVYGYDYLGIEEAEGTSLDEFYGARDDNTLTVAPRRPSYAAGFAEGVWEGGDLTVRGGLRVARFASNATALFDPFAYVDLYRAGDLAGGSITDPTTGEQIAAPSGGIPASIPSTAALYVEGGGTVIGYRDLDGAFYDATGATVNSNEVVNFGRPIAVGGATRITPAALADAPTTVHVLPRAEVELRASSRLALTAFVNRFARQPDPALAFPSLLDLENVRRGQSYVANGSLRPETLTEIGAGIRQSVGREGTTHGEVGATLFLRRYQNRVRLERSAISFPTSTTTPVNGGREDVPGATLRARVISGRLNARGAITVLRERVEERQIPGTNELGTTDALAADAVVALAVVTEATDGPALGSFFPLGGVQLGAVLRVASGDTYRPALATQPISVPFEDRVASGPRQRGTTRARLDLRLARLFRLGPSAFEVSVEVVNVLGRTNALDVYPSTGLPDDDGFLATDPIQVTGLSTEIEREAYRALYSARVRDPLNVGRPRMARVGLRLTL